MRASPSRLRAPFTPDILESDGIKSYHNVGGLPEDLQFELVEPECSGDEVRVVGKALGLPDNMVYRRFLRPRFGRPGLVRSRGPAPTPSAPRTVNPQQ